MVFTEAEFIEKVADTHKIEWLVPNAQKNEMEPIRVTVEPHTTLEEDVPHEGEEFGYVISGRVWLHIGQAAYCVKKAKCFTSRRTNLTALKTAPTKKPWCFGLLHRPRSDK